MPAEKTKPGTDCMTEDYKHSMHGADGSHQNSHKKLGGVRARVVEGHPDEMAPNDGRTE